MDVFNGAKKAKILDYYTMMPETPHSHNLSPAARQRIPIRGACNICSKPIRGSHRVKSNFICHLKRCHPLAYDEFEVRSGRKSALLSISSLDDPSRMVATVNHMTGEQMLHQGFNTMPIPPPAHLGVSSAASAAAYSAAVDSRIKQESRCMPPGIYPSDVVFPPPAQMPLRSPTSSMSTSTPVFSHSNALPPANPVMPRSNSLSASIPVISRSNSMSTSTPVMPRSISMSASTMVTPYSHSVSAAASLTPNVNNSVPNSVTMDSQKEIVDKALMDFVIGNLIPLEVIDSSSFKNMIRTARIARDCPISSAEELKDIIQQKSTEQTQCVKEKLRWIASFCLSQEWWGPFRNGKHYATISVHYIRDWSYNHMMVLCKEMQDNEVFDQMSFMATFQQEYAEFQPAALERVICNLSHKQFLPGFLGSEGMPVFDAHDESTVYNHCFTHELGNVIARVLQGDAQSHIRQLITKASKLLFTSALDRTDDATQATQWHDQLKLLDFVIIRSEEARNELNSEHCLLDAAEMIELRNVLDMLKPFQDVVANFMTAGATTCSGSLVVPYHRLLIQTLAELEVKHPTSTLLRGLHQSFLERTDFVEERSTRATIYTTSTTLDPRFKLRWCDDKDYDMYKDHLILIAKNVVREKSEPVDTAKTNGSFSSVFAKILKQPSESSEDAAVATEVLRYLREPIIGEDSDVLRYWRQNELNFPSLGVLASKYLAIPTSSADLEGFKSVERMTAPANELSGELLENIIELSAGSFDD